MTGVQTCALPIFVAFVPVLFAGSGKEAHECLAVLSTGVDWFQRSNRLSVTIKMYRNFAQGKILKVVRNLRVASVEGVIIDASDYQSCWELPGKQLLVISVHVSSRDIVCLAYDASDGVLARPASSAFARAKKTDGLSCTLRTNKTALIILTL